MLISNSLSFSTGSCYFIKSQTGGRVIKRYKKLSRFSILPSDQTFANRFSLYIPPNFCHFPLVLLTVSGPIWMCVTQPARLTIHGEGCFAINISTRPNLTHKQAFTITQKINCSKVSLPNCVGGSYNLIC